MAGFGNPYVGGQGALVRPSIHSPGFISGSFGWTINRDGSFEFNGGIFRGNVVITSSNDLLVYSTAVPTANKLVLAVAGSAGNDGLGNSWSLGLNLYNAAGVQIGAWSTTGFVITNDASAGQIIIQATNTGTKSPRIYFYSGQAGISSVNAFMESNNLGVRDAYFLVGPITALDAQLSFVDLQLEGAVPGAPGSASGLFQWVNNVTSAVLGQWDNNGFHIFAGDVTGVQIGTSNPPTAETWHVAALAGGWSAAVGSNPILKYRALAEKNTLWLCGSSTFAGTPGGGTTVTTLPIGYRPDHIHLAWGYDTAHSALVPIEINTTGAVTLFAAAGLNPNVFFNCMIPLVI